MMLVMTGSDLVMWVVMLLLLLLRGRSCCLSLMLLLLSSGCDQMISEGVSSDSCQTTGASPVGDSSATRQVGNVPLALDIHDE